jgi:hypothetical protein
MDANRRKYVAREFLRRFCGASEERNGFDAGLTEFRNSTLEMRRDVAEGLLSISHDVSESLFDRGFALCVLGMMARICGVVGEEEFERQILEIIECPFSQAGGSNGRTPEPAVWQMRVRGIIALLGVNRTAGLEKIDALLRLRPKAQYALELRRLRDQFSNQAGPGQGTGSGS